MSTKNSLNTGYIARHKERELIHLLMKEDRYMVYSVYKKHDLEYGHITESSFNSIKRKLNYGKLNNISASYSKEDVIEEYKAYLQELKVKREDAYNVAKRKLQECNDFIEYMEGL